MNAKTLAAIAAMLATTSISAAEIKVLASNGVKEALNELAPAFERETRHKLVISFGLAAALKRQIEAGEALLGGHAKPSHCLGVVLRDTPSRHVQAAESLLSVCVALLGKRAQKAEFGRVIAPLMGCLRLLKRLSAHRNRESGYHEHAGDDDSPYHRVFPISPEHTGRLRQSSRAAISAGSGST